MKVGDLVKRRVTPYYIGRTMKTENSDTGIIVDRDNVLIRVKWFGVEIAKWIAPNNVEVISESR
tara:strand:- start:133 stop:324 length:192 start_codon:yes stop_codon:yes gene_type:complete